MNKRKKIIVNPKIQMKLITLIVFVAFLPILVLFIGFMMYTAQIITDIPADNETVLQLVESVQRLNILTFIGFIAILIGLVVVETQFLHKIIGPLYRIQVDLNEKLNINDFSKKITIRKGDYLQSFVDTLNELLNRVK